MAYSKLEAQYYEEYKAGPLLAECNFTQRLPLNELPVWLPLEYRHEHFYDEVGTNIFRCSKCGHTITLEFAEQYAGGASDYEYGNRPYGKTPLESPDPGEE